MIKQAEDEYRPQEIERQVREFWRRAGVYRRAVEVRSKGEDFYFTDGPPYTTGSIHLGLVLNKTIKDMVVRWRRMHGYHVRDQPGYDMHGLPIEVQVERTLGITNKKEIEDLGIERFVTACREFSVDLLGKMNLSFQQLGVWLDWDAPYMTITNDFVEGAWWTFKRAHERGLLYEALRSIQWCSRCETALAEAEVEYSDETDPSLYVKFPRKDAPDESFLIWTTTPWTLPANLAIAAHPRYTYAKVQVSRGGRKEFLWMLESTVPLVMGLTSSGYAVVETRPGAELVGIEYVHPLATKVPFQATVRGEWVHKVVSSETVEAEHTGLVHTAPGHGPEDFELGQSLGLPIFSPVDGRGRFLPDAGAYAEKRVKDANPGILADLRAAHALYAEETITHSYGHCWRCRTPILFRAAVQWFLKVTEFKPRMLEEIRRVTWHPDWAGSARQMNWTENLRDWCVSRQRYWGIPLPIWRCGTCRHWTVVGSAEELAGAQGYEPGMDLHRPGVDRVILPCSRCQGEMRRVPDILDVWWDSGVASWASLGYPRREDEFRRWWPADWIVEGPDQTRGWFSSQLAAGVVAFDRAPYDSVMMNGWVNGPDGRAMHRHLGNYVDADEMMTKYGVDPLRFYVLSVNAPWEDITFQEEGVRTAQRTLNILWNVLRFATTYMVLDRFDPKAQSLSNLEDALRPEDRWLMSRLEAVKAAFDNEMEGYKLHRAHRAVDAFILEDLSRWYVKLARDRTWIDSEDRGKLSAHAVLFEVLRTVAVLLAPAVPHLAEAIYQRLDGESLSVHMLDWPRPEANRIDRDLEASMSIVQDLVEAVSRARQTAGRKLRWPVRLVALRGATPAAARSLETLAPLLLDQANARDFALLGPEDAFPGRTLVLKPDPGAIGKAYRALGPKIAAVLEARPAEEVRKALEKGSYPLQVEGQAVTIEPGMVRFEARTPHEVAQVPTPHGELFVDLRLTPEIQSEGYAREIIRRIQQMRRDLRLEVDDFVVAVLRAGKDLAGAIDAARDLIARESRARSLSLVDGEVRAEHVVEWDNVDGQTVTIGLTPLHMTEALREFPRIPGITLSKAMLLFDAGYKSVAALRAASTAELGSIEGLEPGDATRIAEHLSVPEEPLRTCPVCGATIPRAARECPRCGALAEGAATPCPHCGASLPPGSKVCPSCGGSLEAEGTGPRPASATPSSLRPGSVYLVEEAQPDEVYRRLGETLASGLRGFGISRMHPDKLRARLNDPNLPVLWLSNVGKEGSVRPQDLERLSAAAEQFLRREKGVILLDGLEYLLTNNNFLTVLRFLQSLRDRVALQEGVLLVSMNPSALEGPQRTLLEREVDEVIARSEAPPPSGPGRGG